MDAGIIKNFKHFYKSKLVTSMIEFYDTAKNSKFQMTVYDALIMTNAAWNNVTPQTIKNCYSHTGFSNVVNPNL